MRTSHCGLCFAAVFVLLAAAMHSASGAVVDTTAGAQFHAADSVSGGNSDVTTDKIPGKLLWTTSFPNKTVSAPVVKNGFALVVASTRGNGANPVYGSAHCMTVRGEKLWEYPFNGGKPVGIPDSRFIIADIIITGADGPSSSHTNGTKTVADGANGVVLVSWYARVNSTYIGYVLAAVDLRTGKELWQKGYGDDALLGTSYATTSTTIYVCDAVAVTAHDIRSGAVVWQQPLTRARSLIIHNGVLYACQRTTINAMNPLTGVVLWSTYFGGLPQPLVFGNGLIYTFGIRFVDVTALYASNGTTAWEHYTGGFVDKVAVVGHVLFVAHTEFLGFTHDMVMLNAVTGDHLLMNVTSTYTDLLGQHGNDEFIAVEKDHMYYFGMANATGTVALASSPYPHQRYNINSMPPTLFTYDSGVVYFVDGASGAGGLFDFTRVMYAMNATTGSVKWSAVASEGGCGSFGRAKEFSDGIMLVTCKYSSEIIATQLLP